MSYLTRFSVINSFKKELLPLKKKRGKKEGMEGGRLAEANLWQVTSAALPCFLSSAMGTVPRRAAKRIRSVSPCHALGPAPGRGKRSRNALVLTVTDRAP